MEQYGTLESPFDPDYLVEVVGQAGFTQVTRFAAVDDLLDVSAPDEELRRIETLFKFPPMNTVIAFNPLPEGTEIVGEEFAARIEAAGPWIEDGDHLTLPVMVTNAGRAFWPAGVAPMYGIIIARALRACERGTHRASTPRLAPLPLARRIRRGRDPHRASRC